MNIFINKPIESITLADVQGYATALHQSSLAVSSVAKAIAAIKSLFTLAHQKTELLKANPAGAVTLPKVKVSAVVILTLDCIIKQLGQFGIEVILKGYVGC